MTSKPSPPFSCDVRELPTTEAQLHALAAALLEWSTLARDAAEDAGSPDPARRMRAVVVLRAMASAMLFTAESAGRETST